MKVSAFDLEDRIFEMEEIRVVIRVSKYEQKYEQYNYKRKAADNISIQKWYENRLKPLIGDDTAEIIMGGGSIPHNRMSMEMIRNSYVN